ncbi:hypothetical protein J4232_00635 [Candidatus Woesearchaeota archaeon]|nr:hypothetical protein [Candidatus Woesearchaeota archaeon]
MYSSKFLETAKRIIRENPEVFEALEEYDRTRKLRKVSYRERINFTIDSSLLSQFKNYCRDKNINMSRLIEKHMKEEIRG